VGPPGGAARVQAGDQATADRRPDSIAGCIECDAGFTWDNTGDVFRQPAVVQRTVARDGE